MQQSFLDQKMEPKEDVC